MKRLFPLLIAVPGIALAGESIQERADMSASGKVTVVNISGDIDISTWDRDEVELTGELGEDSELVFDVSGGNVRIEVETEDSSGWGRGPEPTDLVVRVPVGADLDISGVSSNIQIDDAGGDTLEAESVSGDVEVTGDVERLELTSVSGDVEFRGMATRSSVETVSGDIDLEGLSGELEVSLVSGDVSLIGGEFESGRFESVSGSLELDLGVSRNGRLSVETMSGDAILGLPSGQEGEFRAQTFSGDIRSEFGKAVRDRTGPGQRLEHVEGDGGAVIRVESFSGDIRIGTQ